MVWGVSNKAKPEFVPQKSHSLSNPISVAQPVRIITQGRLLWQGIVLLLPSTHCRFKIIPLNILPTEHCQLFIYGNVSFFGVIFWNWSILNSILLAYLMITCLHFVYVILTGSHSHLVLMRIKINWNIIISVGPYSFCLVRYDCFALRYDYRVITTAHINVTEMWTWLGSCRTYEQYG